MQRTWIWLVLGLASSCHGSGGGYLGPEEGGSGGSSGAAGATGTNGGHAGEPGIVTECVGRSPGDLVCRGRERFECGPDLTTRQDVELCAGECEAGSCVPCATEPCATDCSPGSTRCSGNAVQTCDDAGQWSTPEPCAAATPHCSAGACIHPPSCQGLPATCGGGTTSCCNSPVVTGGSFDRANNEGYPATVADVRLDKFEVTVGRYRRFVSAVVDGWTPAEGSGKHAHLHGGSGLVGAGGSDEYEPGWNMAWNSHLPDEQADWDTALGCHPSDATWTATSGANELRPVTCLNWYQAYAFCVWDGGFLPSEAEWNYAAAGGDEQRTYPWGEAAPTTSLAVYGCAGRGDCAGDATSIAPVGSLVAGNGKYGHSDLAGNVWEWNLDGVAVYGVPCTDCAELANVANRVNRGGDFLQAASYLLNSDRGTAPPEAQSYLRGLRCARVP